MIIVTGAAGFIGSNIVAALNSANRDDILAVDNAGAAEQTGNLKELRVSKYLAKEELPGWLNQNAASVEGVIHMGACSDTTETDREFIMRVNFEYTKTLWEFCTRHEKRFVYASSAATYGDGSAGYNDTADPKRLKPLNLYGESKQRFDLWALEQKSAPVWAGLKFFNVFGPREQHKGRMASVVLHSFKQIRESGKVRLFKSDRSDFPDGGQKRDFIYVKDVVAAVLHFYRVAPNKLRVPNISGNLFNVGTGKARTFADLASATFRALGREPNIEYIPMPADLKGKYQYFTQATTEKLRASGFDQPFTSLEDGVADYVKHYLVPNS